MGEEVMITIFEIGYNRVWTGGTQSIDEAAGTTDGWVRSAPPQLQAGEFARWVGGGLWEVIDEAVLIAEKKTQKLAALAARRWQAETGGIVFMGMSIRTDEDTQRKITGAYVQADKNPSFTAKWKMDAGVFVTLDAATIIAIGDAVTGHIQTCFDKEGDLSDLILAATDDGALDAIDIESGWNGV